MSLRVLLADESASIRKVFQLGLQDFGAEVKSVHNGLDVIEVAETYKPHIIFADILLQKKNGYEVCEEIMQHDQLGQVPVVLMWSSFMELDRKRYSGSGALGELEKPFDVEQMRNLITHLVEHTKSQKISEFLDFPQTITQEFIDEEAQKQQGQWSETEVDEPEESPQELEFEIEEPEPDNQFSIPYRAESPATEPEESYEEENHHDSDETDDVEEEDDEPQTHTRLAYKQADDDSGQLEPEAHSVFNIQALDDEIESDEAEPAPFSSRAKADAMEYEEDDSWQAQPLNDQSFKSEDDKELEDHFDQFQSMDLQKDKKLNLEDFLYRPASGMTPPPTPEPTESKISNLRVAPNTQVPMPDTQRISAEETEAIIRSETRAMLKKVIATELPKIMEKIVREELQRILEQELAVKTSNQNP